jgi:hypothetical protein
MLNNKELCDLYRSAGIVVTCVGLNDRGSISVKGHRRATASKPALGPTQPHIPWIPGSITGICLPGLEAGHSFHLVPGLKMPARGSICHAQPVLHKITHLYGADISQYCIWGVARGSALRLQQLQVWRADSCCCSPSAIRTQDTGAVLGREAV